METKAPSQLSDFCPETLFELPEPSPSGRLLTLKIRALQFDEVLRALKRLPGEVPGGKWKKGEDEDQAYGLENLDALEHDLKLADPVIRDLVAPAVLEPAITFADPPEPGRLPWSWLSIRNRMAVFHFILKWSGYEGGAAEKTKSVDGQHARGRASRVGNRRGRKAPRS